MNCVKLNDAAVSLKSVCGVAPDVGYGCDYVADESAICLDKLICVTNSPKHTVTSDGALGVRRARSPYVGSVGTTSPSNVEDTCSRGSPLKKKRTEPCADDLSGHLSWDISALGVGSGVSDVIREELCGSAKHRLRACEKRALQGAWIASGLGPLSVRGCMVTYEVMSEKKFSLQGRSDGTICLGGWTTQIRVASPKYLRWVCGSLGDGGSDVIIWRRVVNTECSGGQF